MTRSTSDREHGAKTPGQDVLGLVLFALFAFAALSIFLVLLGQHSDYWVTRPVAALVGALGAMPAMVLSAGIAGLGLILFVRQDELPVPRHLLGIVLLAMGGALVLGALSPGQGGVVGNLLPASLGATAGLVTAIALGVILSLATVYSFVRGPEGAAASKPLEPSALVPPRRAPLDGVSAAEAMALQPARKAPPRPSAPAPPKDVRIGGGVPAGTAPLESFDDHRPSYLQGSREDDAGSGFLAAAAPLPAADLADEDLAPDWEGEREPSDLVEAPEAAELRTLGLTEPSVEVPVPSWELPPAEEAAAESPEPPAEDFEEPEEPDELLETAAALEEDELYDPAQREAAEFEALEPEGELEEQEKELEELGEEHEPLVGPLTGNSASRPPRTPAWEQVGLFDEVATESEEAASEVELAPQPRGQTPSKAAKRIAAPAKDPSGSMLYEAGLVILEENRVAVSMLQRRFGIDFDQACELLDKLQELGLIGPYVGGRNRELLLDLAEWQALQPDVLAAI